MNSYLFASLLMTVLGQCCPIQFDASLIPVVVVQPENMFVIETFANRNTNRTLSISCAAIHLSKTVYFDWYFIELDESRSSCVMPSLYTAQLVRRSSQYEVKIQENKSTLIFSSDLSDRTHYCVAYNRYGATRSELSFFVTVRLKADTKLKEIRPSRSNSAVYLCFTLVDKEMTNYTQIYDWGLNYRWYRVNKKGKRDLIEEEDKNAKFHGPLLSIHSLKVDKKSKYFLCEAYLNETLLFTQLSETIRKRKGKKSIRIVAYYLGRPLKIPNDRQFDNTESGESLQLTEGEPLTVFCLFGHWTADSINSIQGQNAKSDSARQAITFDKLKETKWLTLVCSKSSEFRRIHITVKKLVMLYSPPLVDKYLPENDLEDRMSLTCAYSDESEGKTSQLMWFMNNALLDSSSEDFEFSTKSSSSRLTIFRNSYQYRNKVFQCSLSYCRDNQIVDDHLIRTVEDRTISTFRLIGQPTSQEQTLIVDFLSKRDTYIVNVDSILNPFAILTIYFSKKVPLYLTEYADLQCKIDICSTQPCCVYFREIDSEPHKSKIYAFWINDTLHQENYEEVNLRLNCSASILSDNFSSLHFIQAILCNNCSEEMTAQEKSTLKLAKTIFTPINSAQLALNAAENIENLTQNATMLKSVDISLAVMGINNLMQSGSISTNISKPLLLSFNNLLHADVDCFQLSQSMTSSGEQFFNQIDKFSMNLEVDNNLSIVLSEPKISMAALMTRRMNHLAGKFVSFKTNINNGRSELFLMKDYSPFISENSTEDSMEIIIDKSFIVSHKISFHYLKSDMLTQILQKQDSNMTREAPLTPLIAAQAILNNSLNEFPIHILARHLAVNKSAVLTCAFWDVGEQRWSQEGCEEPISNQARTVSECKCNHLTNFAILISYNSNIDLNDSDNEILTWLSRINLILSSICLAITVIIYTTYHQHVYIHQRHLNYQHSLLTSIRVVLSFSLTLLLGNVAFLSTSHHTENDSLCKIIGVLYHCLYLSVFCWSVVQALLLVNNVVIIALREKSVVAMHINHVFLKSAIFAWGLPLSIAVVTLSINYPDNYGSYALLGTGRTFEVCFIAKENVRIFAFILPCGLMLLIDFVSFLLIIYVLMRHSRNNRTFNENKDDEKSFERRKLQRKQTLKGLFGLVFMLSLFWVTGLIQINAVTQYIFVLSTTLQGCFIFVFYCLLKQDVQKYIRDSSSVSQIISKISSTSISFPTDQSLKAVFTKSSNSTRFYVSDMSNSSDYASSLKS